MKASHWKKGCVFLILAALLLVPACAAGEAEQAELEEEVAGEPESEEAAPEPAADEESEVEAEVEPETEDLEPVTLKVQLFPFLSYGPYYIGVEEGYFAEQGIEIEFVEISNSDSYPLLAEGDLDVSAGFDIGYLNAIARGARISVVADKGYLDADGCTAFALVARKALVDAGELDSAAQLAGRTVSFKPGSVEEYFIETLLDTADLPIDAVEGVDMIAPAELDAMQSGALDFTSTSEPWVTRLANAGIGTTWMPTQELVPDFQSGTILYGPNLLDENPDVGRRFMIGYLKAVRQWNEGKTDRNLALMSAFTEMSVEELEQTCWISIHDTGEINSQSLLDFQEWALAKGYLDGLVAEEDFWDPSFIEYANGVLDSE